MKDKEHSFVVKADSNFDYTILKSGNDYDYKLFLEVLKVYHEYTAKKMKICIEKNSYKIFNRDFSENLDLITDEFKEKCERICPNEVELCDIALDICYSNKNSKAFAWELFGEQIIKNLLDKNKNEENEIRKSSFKRVFCLSIIDLLAQLCPLIFFISSLDFLFIILVPLIIFPRLHQ